MKKLIFVFALCIVCLTQTGLTQNTVAAFASQHGIYLKLENDYPTFTPGVYPEYIIERKKQGDKKFKQIAVVKVPNTYEMFVANLQSAIEITPEPLLMRQIAAEEIWKKYTTGGYEAISAFSNALFVQLALGIKYYDASPEPNVMYEYVITKKAAAAPTTIYTNAISYPGKMMDYQIKYIDKKESGLNIKMTFACKDEVPALIRIYREEQYSGKFIPIRANRVKTTHNDSTYFYVSDTLVKPNTVYRYYALPLDYYGNYGKPSDTITAISTAKQYIGNIREMDVVSYNDGVAIKWDLQNAENFSAIAIYRSSNYDSAFTKIASVPASDSQFVDRGIQPMLMYFYYVQPLSRTGTSLPASAKVSAMYTPTLQPLAPSITDITSAEKGITLNIINNDPSTRGLRIYRKLKTDSLYQLVSELVKISGTNTVFTDTTGLQSGGYYTYAVKAENTAYVLSKNSNEVSIRLTTTKSIPEMGIPSVTQVSKGLLVVWKPLSNTAITGFKLFRKNESGEVICLEQNAPQQQLAYLDTVLTNGKYSYGIQYFDDIGNGSAIAYSDAVLYAGNRLSTKGPANVIVNKLNEQTIISWKPINESNIKGYRIYRITGDTTTNLLGEVTATNNQFTLQNTKPEEVYRIFITYVTEGNLESEPGKIVNYIVE